MSISTPVVFGLLLLLASQAGVGAVPGAADRETECRAKVQKENVLPDEIADYLEACQATTSKPGEQDTGPAARLRDVG